MTHDWNNTRDLLVAGSVAAFKSFFALHPISTVRAIGYTWEWGQPQAAFYCVVNTQAGLEQGMIDANRYVQTPLTPEQAADKVRWNAGYFLYPGGFLGPSDELGIAWEAEANRLYDLTQAMMEIDTSDEAQYAAYTGNYEAFLENLVTMCCEALADLQALGVFDGAHSLDFYVGSTDDSGDIVRDRDGRIRQVIAARGNQP